VEVIQFLLRVVRDTFGINRPGFHSRPVHVGLALDEVALGGVSHQVLLFYVVDITSPMLDTDLSPTFYNIGSWQSLNNTNKGQHKYRNYISSCIIHL